jgi:hypothetical protein
MPVNIFISYSHNDLDRPMLDRLIGHLKPKVRSGKIKVWDDSQLPAGAPWDKTIKDQLSAADIVILLVSSEFNSSDYIWRVEIKKAFALEKKGLCRVIPILLRECDFSEMPYAKLEILPKTEHNQKLVPLNQWDFEDKAYTAIVKRINQVVEGIAQAKSAPSTLVDKKKEAPKHPTLVDKKKKAPEQPLEVYLPNDLDIANLKRRLDSLRSLIQDLEEQLDVTRSPLDRKRLSLDLKQTREQYNEVLAKL